MNQEKLKKTAKIWKKIEKGLKPGKLKR